MKYSVAIEAVWGLASQEAVSVRFAEIEPEHFLEALLRFSETSLDDAADLAPDPTIARHLAREAGELERALAKRSIDSTRIRRELRVALGSGQAPQPGDVMHRSAGSRDVFDRAAELAGHAGSDVLTCTYLLEAVLASPTRVIARVLGDALDPATQTEVENGPSLLLQHGKDLVRAARELPTPRSPGTPECKAALQALAPGDGKSLLLVAERPEIVESLLEEVARRIALRDGDERLWSRRIVDVRQAATGRGESAEDRAFLERLLSEASSVGSILLVVPPLTAGGGGGTSGSDDWSSWLRDALTRIRVPCLCPVSPAVYRRSIARDASWKGIARVIWLHSDDDAEIPWEL